MKRIVLISMSALLISAGWGCSSKTDSSEENVSMEESQETEENDRPSPLEVKSGEINGKDFRVQYGSPAVKDRTIWGDLVPYDVVWRTGANEATFVEIVEEMTVEGQSIAPGKYSLFTIPKSSGTWTVIFNSDWDLEHGHFQYDEKNDVLRVEVSPEWEEAVQERLSIDIENPGLVIRWEKLKLPITIQ
ncbi:DUF2911 domain-containing protein [Algoriphagus hitonicola]|uniref:DUF2911 domain-containing protein n=1 Tax=Algoriphagus hitonicola TaxID=435880 RepID=A0A1I2X6N3_9BACT|nr:DUF2911 domain-containing protein [Algoriphagus hitonicola]SFH08687.1 Protein of unknown function [Algoriphagus hitonicola]